IFALLADTVLALLFIDRLPNSHPTYARIVNYVTLGLLVFGLACFSLQLFTLGVTEAGPLDRAGGRNLLKSVPWYFYIRWMIIILAIETLLSFSLGIAIIWRLQGPLHDQMGEWIIDICYEVWLPL